MLSTERIRELRQMLKDCSGGEWEAVPTTGTAGEWRVWWDSRLVAAFFDRHGLFVGTGNAKANARLVVSTHNVLGELLDEIERLQALVEAPRPIQHNTASTQRMMSE